MHASVENRLSSFDDTASRRTIESNWCSSIRILRPFDDALQSAVFHKYYHSSKV